MKTPLLFDLDGTLVDSLRGIADTLNRTLRSHGLPIHPDPRIRTFIGDGLRNLILRALPPDTPDSLVGPLLETYRLDYQRTWQQGSQPYPGIPDLLATLSDEGFPLAVLSNKVHSFTVEMVQTVFPEIRFAAILGQRDGIPHKPDPHGAFELARILDQKPARCLFIGDSTVDLLTARNAGMPAIAVGWGYHDPSALQLAGATRIAGDASELRTMIHAGTSP